ncbi:hypothetical protein [Streptomyces sp. NPDC059631]|uniref:hypothetical protein n=1 Tax=unclassified Streptomyces TaxID=2593676 RepID=UPI00367F48B0
MTAPDALTIHQLLGRIVYFHALHIAPEQRTDAPPQPGPLCCNHLAASGRQSVADVLTGSAWSALVEVATALPAHHRPCPRADGTCCATCCVTAAAAATAGGWATTEHRAYRHNRSAARLAAACGSAAAVRVGRIFADQHNAGCPGLDSIPAPASQELPGPDTLPLTGELLALWADPAATTRTPVASWLNHCTGLGDIRRVLDSMRSVT